MEISRIKEIVPALRITTEFVIGFLGIVLGISTIAENSTIGLTAMSIGLIGVIGSFVEAGATLRRGD